MQNKIQKGIHNLELPNKTNDLCKSLVHFNQLTPYPYSDLQIVDWAKSVEELAPEITPEIIKSIIDGLKIGAIPFDSKLGIQNIFIGYKYFLKTAISELNKKQYGTNPNEVEMKEFDLLRKSLEEQIKRLGGSKTELQYNL